MYNVQDQCVLVENAEQELGKIFESLAQQSCKIIRCFKKKTSKKKKKHGQIES